MKKQDIVPCTLAVALLAALSVTTAFAAKKTGPSRVVLPQATSNASETYHRFIITYRNDAKARTDRNAVMKGVNAALTRSNLTVRGKAVSAKYLRKLAVGPELVSTSAGLDAAQAQAFMRSLKADPNVVSVSIDRKRQLIDAARAPANAQPQLVPDDTFFANYHWNFKAPDGVVSGDGGPNRGGVDGTTAWDSADGAGVVIAILDTGITEHPDLDTSLGDAGYDFITDAATSGRDTDGRVPGGWDTGDWTHLAPYNNCLRISSSSWHGTNVAAIAGAELTNNGLGMSGLAHGARILPVRVLGHCGGYTSDIVDAIVWSAGGTVDGVPANANPASVINLSLGGAGPCEAVEEEAIAEANALGATVVISAGNSNADTSGYSPGNCPGAITVAATGITSRRAHYSNYGSGIEISAPGGGVYANDASSGTQINSGFVWSALNPSETTPTPLEDIDPANDYGGYAGTSQAAPHVAGVIALMHDARSRAGLPELTPAEVLDMLQDTATPFTVAPETSKPIGPGIVNAAEAIAAASEPPCTENCEPDATPLVNRVPVTGLAGSAGDEVLYSFEATAGAVLSFMTYGGKGDVSMYVSFDEEPTTTEFDAKSTRAGNSETVRFKAPQAGTYYIKLVGVRAYSNVTLVARQ